MLLFRFIFFVKLMELLRRIEAAGSEIKKMSFFSQGDGEGNISTNICTCTKNGEKIGEKKKEKYIISEEES